MDIFLHVIAALLITAGLLGAVIPAVPGIPLIFGGIWLIAGADHYRHLGLGWLLGIALVGTLGLTVDLLAGALGAKRVGASKQAVSGALLGTVVGLFLGLPGLLFGPFLGAVLGEFSSGNSVLRSAHVGVAAWIGLLFGTLIKLVSSLMMMALFAAGWWWNGGSAVASSAGDGLRDGHAAQVHAARPERTQHGAGRIQNHDHDQPS